MKEYQYLLNINDPADLRKLPLESLPTVCKEIREYIIETLSEVGGHFASNLGVVELTVALHYAFQTPTDRLIWDVGHQTYPHKILTGRRDALKTIRKFGGISGFPKREESIYDLYNTGHAGTSISQLLGEAVSRDMTGKTYECIAVIGDASIGCGMALEALNHGGHIKP
ncbi:MAG: 1-deoxy-D-xylulose-5-phosphate synthase, partial [Leptospiraceae bacterium]|nr:1-deoxy-D-xylulose-5-phosphate synthase [Leptospiraceae bacterium]